MIGTFEGAVHRAISQEVQGGLPWGNDYWLDVKDEKELIDKYYREKRTAWAKSPWGKRGNKLLKE